ncbi:MAG: hypothetical protein ACLGHP_12775, partial [Vicinamibacteria bacterium]
VPGNDDASRAIRLYCDVVAEAVLAGKQGGAAARGEDLGAMDEPPAEAVSLVRATTRGRQLEPVARLVTRRARRHVVDGAGRVALEVAD